MENIDLKHIEDKLSEYIYDKKGKRVEVNVLKNVPPRSIMTQLVMQLELGKALGAYEYILEQERLNT